jgi:hypothetical protein
MPARIRKVRFPGVLPPVSDFERLTKARHYLPAGDGLCGVGTPALHAATRLAAFGSVTQLTLPLVERPVQAIGVDSRRSDERGDRRQSTEAEYKRIACGLVPTEHDSVLHNFEYVVDPSSAQWRPTTRR